MNPTEITFDDEFTTATIDGETVHVDGFDVDQQGFINEFTATDGRRWECWAEDTRCFGREATR